MNDEEFRAEMRSRAIQMTDDFQKLLKIDVEIMESMRDMVATARDDVKSRPSRFFEPMGAVGGGGMSSEPGISGSAGPAVAALGGFVMDLISDEAGDIKEFVKDKVGQLLE